MCFILLCNFSCKNRDDSKHDLDFKTRRIDSIYNIALNKELADSIRHKNTNLLFRFAIKENQNSLLYNALMLKTKFHSKFKEIDSALIYSKSIISLGEKLSNYDYLVSGYKKASLYSAKEKDYKNSIFYSQKLLDYALKKRDSSVIALTYSKLGRYSRKDDKLQKSFSFYTKSFKIYEIIGDTINAGKSLLDMSKIQKDLGDFIGSKEAAIDALKYLEQSDQNISISSIYQTISTAFREEKNFKGALGYNNKALSISNRVNDIKIIQNTRANILADQGKYKEAISILTKLKDSSDSKISTNNSYARVIGNLGYIHWKKDSLNEISEKLLTHAQQIRLQNNDAKGLIASNMHLTKYYYYEKPLKALFHAQEALANAIKINSLISQLEALDYIIKLKENPKKEAQLYNDINRELVSTRQQNRKLYAVTKYENEKLIKQNLIIEAESEKKQRLNSWFLFGLITTILGSLLIFIIVKNKHTKEKQKKVYEIERRISKRIHDELANDVYSAMVQLENNTASVSEVAGNLEDVYNKARDLSQEKFSFQSNTEFIDNLRKSLSSYSNDETNVIVKGLIPEIWIDISEEKKLVVIRVLKELLVNMRKHSKANLVSVIFIRNNNNIEIRYIDNGIGVFKEGLSNGVGLVNAENRIQSIGGSFIFDKSIKNGFKLVIEIPV